MRMRRLPARAGSCETLLAVRGDAAHLSDFLRHTRLDHCAFEASECGLLVLLCLLELAQ